MPTHLHLDPFAGIAGDMFLGALLHAGLELEALRAALAPLPLAEPYRLSARPTQRHRIGAIDFQVLLGRTDNPSASATSSGPAARQQHGPAGDQAGAIGAAGSAQTLGAALPAPPLRGAALLANPHASPDAHHQVHYPDILAMIDVLDAPERARTRARRIVTALAEAEALVHDMPVERVHFHEVGAVDSIVDMLGAAVGMELLGIDTASSGPLPLTRGFVRCQHGRMPVPAPATAYLMRGMPTFGAAREFEAVTPTGAAILAGVCEAFGPAPAMTLRAVGYGAGDKDTPDVPNLLRVFVGDI